MYFESTVTLLLIFLTRHLLYNGKNTMQAWGLIVLLVSKAGGHAASIPDVEQDKSAGVLHSQRALAEVTEMIRISHLVHNVSLGKHIYCCFLSKLSPAERGQLAVGHTGWPGCCDL